MKKFIVLSFVVLLFINNFSQSNAYEITFIVNSTEVHDSESVFIVGSDLQLGNWNPAAVNLIKIKDYTWSKSFKFEIRKNLEYKFTKGSWEQEALNDDGSIPGNSILKVLSDTLVTI